MLPAERQRQVGVGSSVGLRESTRVSGKFSRSFQGKLACDFRGSRQKLNFSANCITRGLTTVVVMRPNVVDVGENVRLGSPNCG